MQIEEIKDDNIENLIGGSERLESIASIASVSFNNQ
jgi:hypothetical protein